ncbi:MAG: diaminopimelate decarboxylase [Pirellulaceae bacterium]
MSVATEPSLVGTQWWSRQDLTCVNGQLVFAGRQVERLAREHGTPTFLYSGDRVLQNARRVTDALADAGFGDSSRLHYAMKANRFAPLLTFLKTTGQVSIDACSPNEVEHAIACGFEANEISLTATNLSDADLDRVSRFDGLRINLDSISAIRRWGARKSGSTIGIRINPATGVSRAGNEKLQYCRNETTKFGIYEEQFDSALKACAASDLTVDTIHFHTGCGYLSGQLDAWDQVIQKCVWFIDRVGSVNTVNVGGGLGVPHRDGESKLDLDRWASILKKHFAQRRIRIEVEPGDYLVKDAGILLLTVNTIETRRQTTFVGVDAGFNIAPEPAVYSLPFEPVAVSPRSGEHQPVTLAGNINEALDLFYSDVLMPPLRETDVIALLNAGAYSSSMASNHCMRGEYKELLLFAT